MSTPGTPSLAKTPQPPYYAVIFSSLRTPGDQGYGAMSTVMAELAAKQPGYLGMDAAREAVGITVSYWASRDAIIAWKKDVEHLAAQRMGKERWYAEYRVRIALVEREYGFAADGPA